jgi:hypothetical protein
VATTGWEFDEDVWQIPACQNAGGMRLSFGMLLRIEHSAGIDCVRVEVVRLALPVAIGGKAELQRREFDGCATRAISDTITGTSDAGKVVDAGIGQLFDNVAMRGASGGTNMSNGHIVLPLMENA